MIHNKAKVIKAFQMLVDPGIEAFFCLEENNDTGEWICVFSPSQQLMRMAILRGLKSIPQKL